MAELEGRVIAIAGAAGASAQPLAHRLAPDGAMLALTNVSQERLDPLANDLGLRRTLDGRAVNLLSEDAGAARAGGRARRAFGRVDGLLHLVGG